MKDSERRHRPGERRTYDERRNLDRREMERRTGERRLDSCPTCHGILNAKGYCYNCKKKVVKIA
jgi:hypothetical protein